MTWEVHFSDIFHDQLVNTRGSSEFRESCCAQLVTVPFLACLHCPNAGESAFSYTLTRNAAIPLVVGGVCNSVHHHAKAVKCYTFNNYNN